MSKCPKCGSEYYGVRADNYCLSCDYCGDNTVFQKITQSPEVLAPFLVWEDYDWCVFRSAVIDDREFNYKKEALAATLEKLKEVAE